MAWKIVYQFPLHFNLELIKGQYLNLEKQRWKMVEIPCKSRVGNLMYVMVCTHMTKRCLCCGNCITIFLELFSGLL
jgi:hypothetical protein